MTCASQTNSSTGETDGMASGGSHSTANNMRLRSLSHRSGRPSAWAPSAIEVYAVAVAVAAASAVVGSVWHGWRLGPLWLGLPLALVAAVSERATVPLSSIVQESISLVPTLLVAVLFGPVAAAVVAA